MQARSIPSTPPSVRHERTTRRRGITHAADALGVGYSHLYRCVRWLNGDRDPARARKPGRALEAAISDRYPELIQQEARPC